MTVVAVNDVKPPPVCGCCSSFLSLLTPRLFSSLSSRRSLPLVGGVAGLGQAQLGLGVPAPVRVLPDTHDCELPGAELHRRPCGSAL